jgi:hypothetical protein
MGEDLRRQASELYKERTGQEVIPTSDSLSIKKIIYVSLGVLLLLALVIYHYGGFRNRTDPVIAAIKPHTVAKQPLPPESQAPALPLPASRSTSPTETKPPGSPVASPTGGSTTEPVPKKEVEPVPVTGQDPKSAASAPRRERARDTRAAPAPSHSRAATAAERSNAEAKPVSPPAPEVSPLETARQELARDIVLEKSSALANLVHSPAENLEYKGWKAGADGGDEYQVVFTFQDKSSGASIQYIWRVNVIARTITPQSYYARKLS